jgi:GH25 family lysozyme M1 (1,4-beta-N-acetylmuramidase)
LLTGIDVSSADVNWQEVRRRGATFGGFKLSEGQDFRHPSGTVERYVEIHRAGLMAMPFHFLRPQRRDPTLEVSFYLSCLNSLGYPSRGDLPPVLDIEVTALDPAATRDYLEAACRNLLARNPHSNGIIVYGGPDFLDTISVGGSQFLMQQTARNNIRWWIAHGDRPPGQPQLPRGVGSFLFHQHTLDLEGVPGVTGKCDLDVARPDIDDAQLRRIMFRGSPAPHLALAPAPPPPSQQGDGTTEVQLLLRRIGFPIANGDLGPQTKQAVRDFKRGYAFQPAFVSFDPGVGPITMRRLKKSADLDGACSEHFKFREFASSHSGWIRTHRDLVRGLEKLRAEVGHPIEILSGFRDFNLGASNSQHKFGNAIDPTQRLPLDACKRVQAFSGIGLQPGTQEVRHLDVRHVGPNFTPGATPGNPIIFDDNF